MTCRHGSTSVHCQFPPRHSEFEGGFADKRKRGVLTPKTVRHYGPLSPPVQHSNSLFNAFSRRDKARRALELNSVRDDGPRSGNRLEHWRPDTTTKRPKIELKKLYLYNGGPSCAIYPLQSPSPNIRRPATHLFKETEKISKAERGVFGRTTSKALSTLCRVRMS